ncbi:MAG: ATP synthase F1 subunit delta [Anaerolineae bacterium]|nr:ATP synthase F1 subunit delta [Anaerolineae bacterium]
MSVQARPQDYAAAIYDLALEPWLQNLGTIQKAVKSDAALRAGLDDAGLSTGEKLEQLSQALPNAVTGEIRKFLGTLLEAGQFDQLDTILLELDRLARRRPERRLAQVTSAVPLTEPEEETMRAKLVERFGTDLEIQFEVDASLIGGVYLRVGDQVIDGSVAGKLAALRDHLTA